MKIDGKLIAQNIKDQLRDRLREEGIRPHLVVISTVHNPASHLYVQNKRKACEYIGIEFTLYDVSNFPKECILDLINELNKADSVHGIIVQLPLRSDLVEDELLDSINPDKDVDNFHPYNMGMLVKHSSGYCPCTPLGISRLIDYYNIDTKGKHCVIVGRSAIVGKPMAMEMLRKDATVTICHSHTNNLPAITKQADILISAVGIPSFIKPCFIKEGAVLIDVGMNRDENNKLCGDIDPSCYDISSMYTPVPGGVGQMTVAMLMYNTYLAYFRVGGKF